MGGRLEPDRQDHFPMGRGLAERLGYPSLLLDLISAGAIESFAGVGYFFDLAVPARGEAVLDLGSGSEMDVFIPTVSKATDPPDRLRHRPPGRMHRWRWTVGHLQVVTDSGFVLEQLRWNPFKFLSDSAQAATTKYGVTSVSFLARTR